MKTLPLSKRLWVAHAPKTWSVTERRGNAISNQQQTLVNPSAAPVRIVQRIIYVVILGLFNSTGNYSRANSTSSRLGVKIIVKKSIFVV